LEKLLKFTAKTMRLQILIGTIQTNGKQ